jgi:hypothetical protein
MVIRAYALVCIEEILVPCKLEGISTCKLLYNLPSNIMLGELCFGQFNVAYNCDPEGKSTEPQHTLYSLFIHVYNNCLRT